MKKIISSSTRGVYKKVVKPILFKLKADEVHSKMISTGSFTQAIPGIRSMPKLWAYNNKKYLHQELWDVDFVNPIGLSAGLDKNFQLIGLMKAVGFGFMTGGSVSYRKCDGNPKPWYHRSVENNAMIVHAGLPSEGVRRINNRIKNFPKKYFENFTIIASIVKTNIPETDDIAVAIDDYLGTLKTFELNDRINMYEINISCPNTAGGEPFTKPENLDMLLTEIDNLTLRRPVTVKMPLMANWTHFKKLLDVIVKHNINAVTIANLQKDRHKLMHQIPDNLKGGLSGEPTRDLSTALIKRTYKEYGARLTIIGVGGVFNAEDAYEKIKAGASLVDMITGVIIEGPQVVGQINRGLVKLLKADGFKHVSEAIGADVRD